MGRNILDAIKTIVHTSPSINSGAEQSHNRINAVGEAFEQYIKGVFADTIAEKSRKITQEKVVETFSYLGNQNNPPDAMLKEGDAIEIKKIESFSSALALNSSYPKAKIYADSTMITKACRECEQWCEKDMIYVVGVVDKKSQQLKSIAMVYGQDYCADKYIYERIKSCIKNGITEIEGIEFAETNELGRVNRVDPLGITYLRIRGMWHIENPFTLFSDIHTIDHSADFNLMVVINNDKFFSFDNHQLIYDLADKIETFNISDVEIRDPNNPAVYRGAKLITYKI